MEPSRLAPYCSPRKKCVFCLTYSLVEQTAQINLTQINNLLNGSNASRQKCEFLVKNSFVWEVVGDKREFAVGLGGF